MSSLDQPNGPHSVDGTQSEQPSISHCDTQTSSSLWEQGEGSKRVGKRKNSYQEEATDTCSGCFLVAFEPLGADRTGPGFIPACAGKPVFLLGSLGSRSSVKRTGQKRVRIGDPSSGPSDASLGLHACTCVPTVHSLQKDSTLQNTPGMVVSNTTFQ